MVKSMSDHLTANDGVAVSRFNDDTAGIHWFGGKPILRVNSLHEKLPIHRILTLDASDPLFPLSGFRHTQLPLFYPLAFSSGGGEIQYTVSKNSRCRVSYVSPSYEHDMPYVTCDRFPEKRGNLVLCLTKRREHWHFQTLGMAMATA